MREKSPIGPRAAAKVSGPEGGCRGIILVMSMAGLVFFPFTLLVIYHWELRPNTFSCGEIYKIKIDLYVVAIVGAYDISIVLTSILYIWRFPAFSVQWGVHSILSIYLCSS